MIDVRLLITALALLAGVAAGRELGGFGDKA
jgi:hypothetical protein